MNILPSVYRESMHFFEQSFLPTLTVQHQKVVAVAVFAFGCLAACYALYYCVKNWKEKASEEKKTEESKIPQDKPEIREEAKARHKGESKIPQDMPKVNEEAKANYKDGMNVFSFEVFQKVIKESANDNKLISPLGISLLLSTIKHGVGPKAQAEIDRIIHLPENSDEMKVSVFELIQELKATGFDFASLVYLNPAYRLNPNYQKLVSEYYQSKVEEGDSADQVNQWVEKSTNGQIKEIITQDDLNGFVVLLANALYFKAKWIEPFVDLDTHDEDFMTPTKIIQTAMMHKIEEVAYFEDDLCQAIKLGYHDAKGVSLMLILPKKDNDFSFINDAAFKVISKSSTSRVVGMAVPRFKIEQEIDVKAMLEEMGMKEIFGDPDLSNLIDFKHRSTDASVSKMKQKSALACDEEGTEASTVTVAIMAECAMIDPEPEKKVIFNRPFLAALVSKETPVLFGVIRDPSAS